MGNLNDVVFCVQAASPSLPNPRSCHCRSSSCVCPRLHPGTRTRRAGGAGVSGATRSARRRRGTRRTGAGRRDPTGATGPRRRPYLRGISGAPAGAGALRVTGSELAYVIDARCAPTIAEVRAGPVGLEFGASRIEVDVSPGCVNVRAARLTLGARGGVGTPGHDPDDEQPSAANNFGDVDVSLEEKAGMSVCLAVVPAVELTLGFDWATLGNVGGGGQDHHGFDSLTGSTFLFISRTGN